MADKKTKLQGIKDGELYSALDLDTMIIQKLKEIVPKENFKKIDKLKEKRIKQKQWNYKWGGIKRHLNNVIKKQEDKIFSIQVKDIPVEKINKLTKNQLNKLKVKYTPEIEQIKKEIKQTEKEIKKIVKFDLKDIDNDINKLTGNKFNFLVNDGFNKTYKISSTDIVKGKKQITKILKKLKKKVEEGIKEDKYEKKTKVLKEKILPKINYNIDAISEGEFDEENYDEDNGNYPILIEIFDDNIIRLF
jgi:hypothetical protein